MTRKRSDQVADQALPREYCSGCGVCAGVCPTSNLAMRMDDYGELTPVATGPCQTHCGKCTSACPFLAVEENEDTIAARLYGQVPGIAHASELGYYLGCHAGYVAEGDYRANGASGGLATWFLASLLQRGVVDKVACVRPSTESDELFRFDVVADVEAVRGAAKSAYYPVHLAKVIQGIRKEEGRYAVIGLPCFLKGLRLAMACDKYLRDRIVVVLGLVCGQLKSAAYTEYLLRAAGLAGSRPDHLVYRGKNPDKSAIDYEFRAGNGQRSVAIGWEHGVAEAWMTGQFKLNACNFCDDTFAEVADVVFMDAWLPAYLHDGRGHNLVVTRTQLAESLLREGSKSGALVLTTLPVEDVIASQLGVVAQKRAHLAHRIWLAEQAGRPYPPKRVPAGRPSHRYKAVTRGRESARKTSREAMRTQKNLGGCGLGYYRIAMAGPLMRLRMLAFLERLHGAIGRRLHSFVRRQA